MLPCNSGSVLKTDKWLEIAKDYFKEKKIECDFATITEVELGNRLRQMYVEFRQKNGEVYSRSSLLGFRAAIHRHLTHDLKQSIDVFKGDAFSGVNTTLDGHLKDMKRKCL